MSSRRAKARERILEDHPRCVYCGGANPSETIDHVPPIVMFDLRQRPKGLEFPACKACNHGARLSDLVAGLIGRLFPDPTKHAEREETRDLFRSVGRNYPGLLEEMQPSDLQRTTFSDAKGVLPQDTHVLNANGPLLTEAMNRFSARVGFALHHWITGAYIPPTGAVYVRWFSNFESFLNKIPLDLVRLVGPPKTLAQGRKSVPKQFLFSSVASEDGKRSAHFATFRVSFAVAAFAVTEVAAMFDAPRQNTFRPGFLLSVGDQHPHPQLGQ